MDFVELSDLEEGEILEFDSYSPVESSDDFEVKNRHFGSFRKESTNHHFGFKDGRGRNLCAPQEEERGYMNKNFKEKLEQNGKLGKSHMGAIDLESISSEGEYKSDGDGKYVAEHKEHMCNNGEKRAKGKQFYGTVEDIMSEIGETICRKSRCNYKKRKSKDFVKYSDNSYDLWRDKVFSSHLKGRKRKRRMSCSDSDSEFSKGWVEKRKKRKRKREVHYEEDGAGKKKPKMRDFDEMRRNLLEKLNKQKAEEMKASEHPSMPEVDSSEIQEVDMLIDCTNYVDAPSGAVRENLLNEIRQTQEKEGEDELDLVKLRLIALASNKKRKSGGNQVRKAESPEGVPVDKKSDDGNREEVDLDRNELLLRAEALKTALLKKHQKRLNKLKIEKPKAVGSSSDNDVNHLSSPVQEDVTCKPIETVDFVNAQAEDGGDSKVSDVPCNHDVSDSQTDQKEPVVSSANPKKANLRAKSKRKKRKSSSLANSLKENSEKSEALEEDDRTLRSQLLSDLMRKKSLKDLEKKPVLTDSVQTSANQIPLLGCCESSKENGKPPAVVSVKKNLLKKVNVAKPSKPVTVPKIPKPEIQRIIVHLGSEDSSDENGGHEERTSVAERESEAKDTAAATEPENAKEKANEVIQASYEKSVELLLSQARKKIEGKMQTTKKNNALTTPEAVYKHLPPSQRLEYLRLKQKIAERERLRKQKGETSAPQRPTDGTNPAGREVANSGVVQPAVISSDVRDKWGVSSNSKFAAGSRTANGATMMMKTTAPRSVTTKMKNNLAGLHGNRSKKHPGLPGAGFRAPQTSSSLLLPSSQALISKLKLLLKKIKIEKMIEENYEKEISKLKNQLNLFERKKTEQRFKIKKLGEESMKTYKAIQGITAKGNEGHDVAKKKEEKDEEGPKTEGDGGGGAKDEEKSEEGKKVPFEPETEITESKIDKELNGDVADGKSSETVSGGTSSVVVGLLEYNSPLQAFTKGTDGSTVRVDPNVAMCQFDLMGVCKDEECTYQHLRTS